MKSAQNDVLVFRVARTDADQWVVAEDGGEQSAVSSDILRDFFAAALLRAADARPASERRVMTRPRRLAVDGRDLPHPETDKYNRRAGCDRRKNAGMQSQSA